MPSPTCLRPASTDHLISILNQSDTSIRRPPCFRQVLNLMNMLYQVDISIDHVTVPVKMVALVRDQWFQGNATLYRMFQNPRVLTVTDRYTSETSNVNLIRSLRPKPLGSGDALKEVLRVIEESRSGCNFCGTDHTLQDTFGRLRVAQNNIFTAENSFRFYDYSGLVIPGDIHNFMEVDYETFKSMILSAAVPWFRNIHSLHRSNTHPILVWDIMSKAGASQVHPHIHTLLGKGRYPGKWGLMDQAKTRYHTDTGGRDYLQDIVDLHVSVGLGMRYKSAAVIVTINPVKDREIWVIGTDNLSDWTCLHFLAYRTFIEELEVYCFSQSMAIPSSEVTGWKKHGVSGDLMVAKIGARGDCTSSFNDVSALELYSINSIAMDYYETMRAFEKTFKKYEPI